MARILVVDDDDQIRDTLRQMLERAGHKVTDAADGEMALKLYRAEPADLVISDIIMPEKEGIETIMELRKQFPKVKIIAISGGGRIGPNGYLELAGKFGALRTFSKPFDRREIIAAIDEIIGL